MTPKMQVISELSDRILELIRDVEEFTQSDLQGVAEAIVMMAVAWGQTNPTNVN